MSCYGHFDYLIKTYNIIPGTDQYAQYEAYHRHLAHELRNEPGTPHSSLTDIYYVGYFIKHLRNPDLISVGRELKAVPPSNRLSLQQGLALLQNVK